MKTYHSWVTGSFAGDQPISKSPLMDVYKVSYCMITWWNLLIPNMIWHMNENMHVGIIPVHVNMQWLSIIIKLISFTWKRDVIVPRKRIYIHIYIIWQTWSICYSIISIINTNQSSNKLKCLNSHNQSIMVSDNRSYHLMNKHNWKGV